MADVQEDFAALTATFKFGGGFDAPWLVARASDAEALEENLLIVKEHNLGKIITDLAKGFHGLYLEADEKPAKASRRSSRDDDDEEEEQEEKRPTRRTSSRSSGTSRSGGGSTRGSSRSKRDDEEPEEHPEGLECEKCERVLVYKSGFKNGKKWAFWQCPVRKGEGDGHDSEWAL